jgi:hypothetical protein
MRRLLLVWPGVLVLAGGLFVTLMAYRSCNVLKSVPYPHKLPDLIGRDSQDEKRSFLLADARRELEHIAQRRESTLLARANCEVAATRLEEDYENVDARPMMIASYLVPLPEQGEYFFFVWCYNAHREHDAIVLVGETPQGTAVRIRYQFKPKVKSGALVNTVAGKTRLVSLDKLLQAGEVFQRNGEVEVHISTQISEAPLVPDLPLLAVAVHDRNGKLSNFVPVCRIKALAGERGEPPQ